MQNIQNMKITLDNNEEYKTQHESVIRSDKVGNVIEHRAIKSNEEIIIRKKSTPQQKAFRRRESALRTFTSKLGGYVNMTYIKNEVLFNKLDIDRANISRLIYLTTYIDYNDRLENLLIKHSKDYKIEALKRSDIKEILNLSDRALINFLNDVKKNNLMFEVDNKFYISNEYFCRGNCKDNNKFNKNDYTRIFIDTTRFLYNSCSARQHKQLSYIYQLVPFMNHELNILCSNPHELYFDKLEKLSLKQICELLKVSTDSRSMRKLREELLKFTVTIDNKQYRFLSWVKVNNTYDYFVINPALIWSGSNLDIVKDTIQVCFFN